MRLVLLLVLAITSLTLAEEKSSTVRQLIPWLLEEDAALKGILFSDVISATSGRRVIPIDRKDKDTARILAAIGKALDEVLAELNGANSPAKKQKRVNEMSKHFEDAIEAKLKAVQGFECDFPKTASGRVQRSGYPDIRLVDTATRRVLYLDPKLYAKNSRHSSLRTFYFTPRRETNKVNDDAHHLIVGIEHEKTGAEVNFTRWELIDLSGFRVRLKAEFEGSNADMYREEAIVGTSGK
jgi:gas vesicle protein